MADSAAPGTSRRWIKVVVFVVVLIVGIRIYAALSGDRGILDVVNVFSRPAVPVQVTFRKSQVGNGLVARFNNEAPSRLVVKVTFTSALHHERQTRVLELAPNGVSEVGWMEGWQFEPGEQVTVAHDDYAMRTFDVPRLR